MYLSKISLLTLLAAKAKSVCSHQDQDQDSSFGSSKPEVMSGSPRSLIFGGQSIDHQEYPWFVTLHARDNAFLCGGSLIDKSYVLTSNACVGSIFKAIVGPSSEIDEETLEIEKILSHEDFYDEDGFLENDIVLLKLNGSSNHTPVTLDDETFFASGATQVRAIGYGFNDTTSDWNDFDSLLMMPNEVELDLIDHDHCHDIIQNKTYGSYHVHESMFCTATDYTKGTCLGDEGGPIIDPSTGNLVGVISYITGCTGNVSNPEEHVPEVHTRVDFHLEWIRSTIDGQKPLEGYHLEYLGSRLDDFEDGGYVHLYSKYSVSANTEYDFIYYEIKECNEGGYPAFFSHDYKNPKEDETEDGYSFEIVSVLHAPTIEDYANYTVCFSQLIEVHSNEYWEKNS